MESTLVGVFENGRSAEDGRARLVAAGFAESAVSLASADGSPGADTRGEGRGAAPHAESAIARFFHSLFGDRHESERSAEAELYREAFRRGAWAVTARARDEREIALAEEALNAAGAIDVDQRARDWRRTERQPDIAASAPRDANAAPRSGERGVAGDERIPVVEEALEVGKRTVVRGRVRVFSHVVQVPIEQQIRLRQEHATVERRPADRLASEDDFLAFREGTLEVREMAEEAVVRKTARVVAEVEIAKRVTVHEQLIRDTVRRTEIEVERVADPAAPARGARRETSDDEFVAPEGRRPPSSP